MKKNIVIHYPFIANYRIPIFKKLSKSENYNIIFWASKKGIDKFLLTTNSNLNMIDTPLRLISIPFLRKKLEWQPLAIKNMLNSDIDTYIVLGNPNSLSTWLCVLIAKVRFIPILMWSHGYLKNEVGFKNFLRKIFFKLADKHLLYGNKAKRIMIEKGFKEKDLYVIYNSLDYKLQKINRENLSYNDRITKRKEYGFKEDSIVFIVIGRLMKKLKIGQVLNAMDLMKKSNKDINLIIVGDGEEKRALYQQAEELNLLDNIIFYGACHDENQLARLYNTADYSVVMGKVGLSAMHSLAYGIPMITNDNMDKHFPEIEAIIENETGFFFKEDNLKDFISKINPIDYRGQIYRNCIKIIEEKYTPDVQKIYIEQALDSIEKK